VNFLFRFRKKCRQPADQLRKVLALNRKINSTLNLDELLTILMTTASEVVNAEVASLLLLDEARENLIFRVALGEKGGALVEKFRVKVGEGIAGHVACCGSPLIVNDTRKDKRFANRFDKQTGFQSKAILCVPLKAKDQLIGVLEAINPRGRKEFCELDLDLLQTFADQAAIAIDNAKLHAEILRQEKARQELAIARDIQQNFLPDLKQLGPWLDIAAKTVPAREVGGDFYDALPLSEERTGVLIADVSGKGVPAALFMVHAVASFRYLAPRYPCPSELLFHLNNVLVKNSTRGMFITLSYLVFDRKHKTLEYSSAGHFPPLRKTFAGEISELENAGGTPLGLFEQTLYPAKKIPFLPGETFLLYTDGISEARDKSGSDYSLERLMRVFKILREKSALQEAEAVMADLEIFTRGADQHDDITVLTVRIPETLPDGAPS
jgi:sigma-B regulation protein RsbU (phosphoserine phosphatase)